MLGELLEAIPPGDQGEIAGGRLGPLGELNPAWVDLGDQQNVARFRFAKRLSTR